VFNQESPAGLHQLDNQPLAERARDMILQAILENRFEGDRLPAEDELAKMLNISRTTIRAALQGLEQDGIITRRRAVGTTVNRHVGPRTLALQRLIHLPWLLEEKGYKARMEVSWTRTTVPPEFAAIFGLEVGEDCYLSERLFFADDKLAVYDRDVVLWSHIEGEIPEDAPDVLFDFSQVHMTAPIDHAVVEIVPGVKRRGVKTKLELASGTPFLRLHQRHYSSRNEALAYSLMDVDDSYIRFEVFRRK
jgi:GntR family transcriptional regulator